MQIKITFTNKEKAVDLLVDNGQKIINTIQIIGENGDLEMDSMDTVRYVKSLRKSRWISVYESYKEAGIYSGDMLNIGVDTI